VYRSNVHAILTVDLLPLRLPTMTSLLVLRSPAPGYRDSMQSGSLKCTSLGMTRTIGPNACVRQSPSIRFTHEAVTKRISAAFSRSCGNTVRLARHRSSIRTMKSTLLSWALAFWQRGEVSL
jgi:hypothetical protein